MAAVCIQIYFRILLRGGKIHNGKFQVGANINPREGDHILNIGIASCHREEGESTPCPPEINPVYHILLLGFDRKSLGGICMIKYCRHYNVLLNLDLFV